jgi:hypothetical protein
VCGISQDYVTLFDTQDASGCVWTYTQQNGTILGPFVCSNLFPTQSCLVFVGTLNIFLTWQPQVPNPPPPVIRIQSYLDQLGLGALQAVNNLQFSVFNKLPSQVAPTFLPSLKYVVSNLIINELNTTTVSHGLLNTTLLEYAQCNDLP